MPVIKQRVMIPKCTFNLKFYLPLFLFFILPLVACPLWGQEGQKKQLKASDYHLWGEVHIDKTAPNGNWVSYKMEYAGGLDTLFVRNSSGTKTYHFPSADQSVFTKDNFFIYQIKDSLYTVNLATGKKEVMAHIIQYSYSVANNLLLILRDSSYNKNTLVIKNSAGKLIKEIKDVTRYSLSPHGRQLLCSTNSNNTNSIILIDLKKLNNPKLLLSNVQLSYDRFHWQKEEKAVAFFSKNKTGSIKSLLYYILEKETLCELDPSMETELSKGAYILDHPINNIVISDDLQKVFLHLQADSVTSPYKTKSEVEIWNTNDKWIYPKEQRDGKFEQRDNVYLWQPELNLLHAVTSKELPFVMLSGDQKYAVLSNPKAYEPQFDFDGHRDYYTLDLSTFKRNIFLTNQSGYYLDVIPSPQGRYITYFRDKNWWVYDLENKTHTDLTSKIGVAFAGKVNALKSDSAFGNPAWSNGDKEILLYDEFDIWAIRADGFSARRLTLGRESGTRYRIAKKNKTNLNPYIYDGQILESFDLTKEIILRVEAADGKTGYCLWKNGTIRDTLFFEDSYMSELHYNADQQGFFCLEQKFNLPPRLLYKEPKKTTRIVFQSNPQHYNYHWGKTELIHFQNSKEQNLKGVLYYPSNYDPQKKYPMIVYIYEIQSNDLHFYYNPSYYNESGFNPAVFTTQDYFVLLPDIVHENENVGTSSADCVVSATRKILERGLVDPQKIALMGHSFGGYETAFIINHTSLFSTAVASGAITDLKSFFFSVGWNIKKPEMWRFATEEWRLNGKTPLANRTDFDRNSPLESIEKLNIPLLMWTGKEDAQVDWHQSIEYYLALRRLGKKGIMLVYPKEGHTLVDPNNQKDLTQRVMQWLDHHLKNEKNSEWINTGLQ
jgi:dipeptidyl aminopeptidase/acylaminoacyl peptidase